MEKGLAENEDRQNPQQILEKDIELFSTTLERRSREHSHLNERVIMLDD